MQVSRQCEFLTGPTEPETLKASTIHAAILINQWKKQLITGTDEALLW